jgi:hypothetical protein
MTSLLQKINDLNVRVDNIDTTGGGGTTDTTALQAQVDINTTDISGIQTNKQNTLIAGDNITITGDTISASGGGGGSSESVHFLCALDQEYTTLLPGKYMRCNNIIFQNPTGTTMVSINSGHGYTIQEDGLYHIGFSLTVQQIAGTLRMGIVYIRNGVENLITSSGITVNLTEDRSIIWPLQTGDILAVKYVNGNAGYLSIYGSGDTNIQTNMYGYKIG